MAAMGNATTGGPSVVFQHLQYPQIFDQAVAERTVELHDIASGPNPGIADQIACVLNGKKILAGCHRTLIVPGKLRLQFIIEGISSFFVPTQMVWFQSMRVRNRGLEIETPIR